jgi:hypothetical protein
MMIESDLADPKVVNNEEFRQFSNVALKYPRGVLFSKNNNRVVAYRQHPTEENTFASMIFIKDKADKYLNAACDGCTADEFFSLVINPVIQQ